MRQPKQNDLLNRNVRVVDEITERIRDGKIVFVEYDTEMEFNWLYIALDNEAMNDKTDPKFIEPYYIMIPSISEYYDFAD